MSAESPTFLLYICLHAKENFEIPLSRFDIPGGTYVLHSNHLKNSTGIGSYHLVMSTPPAGHDENHMVWTSDRMTYVNQTKPFGQHSVTTERFPLYWYGVYDDKDTEVLACTNIDPFDALLQLKASTPWWFCRLRSLDTVNVQLNTSRLITKWQRWRASDTLSDSAKRFSALETQLFPPLKAFDV